MRLDPLSARLRAAEEVARQAGALALDYLADPAKLGIELKGPQDFVSAADRAVERLIIERLAAAFPGDAFLGEESHAHGAVDGEALWVIDPIDGTANFVRGRREWVVSIGFLAAGAPALGVIYHATADALYAAATGKGASRNGAPIRASALTSLASATLVFESSLTIGWRPHARMVEALVGRGGEYRRYGSAALSLALVADGRIDGFIEAHLKPWDVAAGIVLVNEAGGWTNDFFAGDGLTRGNSMIAGAPGLREEILAISASSLRD